MPLLLLFVCAPFRYASTLTSPHHYSGPLLPGIIAGAGAGAGPRVHARACRRIWRGDSSAEARWHAGGNTGPVPTQAGIHEKNAAPARRDPPSYFYFFSSDTPIRHNAEATVPVDTVSATGQPTAKKRVVAVDDPESHEYLKNAAAVPGSGTRSARDLDGRGGGHGGGRGGGGLGAGRGLVVPVGIPRHTCADLGRLKQVTADVARPAVACPELLSSWWADRSRPGHTWAELILTGRPQVSVKKKIDSIGLQYLSATYIGVEPKTVENRFLGGENDRLCSAEIPPFRCPADLVPLRTGARGVIDPRLATQGHLVVLPRAMWVAKGSMHTYG
ncbi:hypothetical protein GGX14DRAFT_391546 [Mycena pura]|uniref:Uncharacterized protein n=1 Tax=Mycena pura TaxID=153505 RepID=A0AAD6YJL1_9AGAR|nr:hypothetical protein GGX14DRAFT_391546 [Mycena pura]